MSFFSVPMADEPRVWSQGATTPLAPPPTALPPLSLLSLSPTLPVGPDYVNTRIGRFTDRLLIFMVGVLCSNYCSEEHPWYVGDLDRDMANTRLKVGTTFNLSL